MKTVQLETTNLILGCRIRSKHAIESNPKEARIAPLWQSFLQEGGTSSIPEAKSPAIYAVYNNYESDVTGSYDLTLGAESNASNDKLHTAKVPAGKYLVFEGKGETPQCTIDAWQEIWTYFADKNSFYKRAYTTDFELYDSPEGVNIYIGIE